MLNVDETGTLRDLNAIHEKGSDTEFGMNPNWGSKEATLLDNLVLQMQLPALAETHYIDQLVAHLGEDGKPDQVYGVLVPRDAEAGQITLDTQIVRLA